MSDIQQDPGLEPAEGRQPLAEPSPEEEPVQEPRYVTTDDLNTLLDSKFEDWGKRISQSVTDRSEPKWKQAVDTAIATLDKRFAEAQRLGVPITKEDYEAERNRITKQAWAGDLETGGEQATPSFDPAAARQQAQYAEATAKMLVKQAEYGFDINPNDPEFATIDWNAEPNKFLAMHDRAMNAKAQRVGNVPIPSPAQPPVNPAARIGSLGASGASAGSQLAQLTAEMTRLQTDPVRNRKRLKELDSEMAKLMSNQ